MRLHPGQGAGVRRGLNRLPTPLDSINGSNAHPRQVALVRLQYRGMQVTLSEISRNRVSLWESLGLESPSRS